MSQPRLDEFDDLLHHEWLHKKKLSKRISSPEPDNLYDMAQREGAIGGKITGDGGGYMLLYCHFDAKHRIGKNERSG